MIEGRTPRQPSALWDRLSLSADVNRLQYRLVLTSETEEELILLLVVDRNLEHICQELLTGAEFVPGPSVEVDLIQFQGPHFCDRDGIADTAFQVLAGDGPELLVYAFMGSRAHLVFPGGTGREAAGLLETVFTVPA